MKLDLSNFFSDERQCSLLFIDATWQTVYDLQQHIQKLFKLDDISLLTNDGCYLPPQESIKVLQSAKSLKAFTLRQTDEECGATKSTNSKCKKRKKSMADSTFASSTPNQSKRSKTFAEPETSRVSVELRVPDTQKSLNKKRLSSSKELRDESVANQSQRLRNSEQSPIPEATPSKSNHCMLSKHTVFDDEPSEETPVETTSIAMENLEEQIMFRCPLLELDTNKPRLIKLPVKPQVIEILENIVIPQQSEMSSLRESIMEEPAKDPDETDATIELDNKSVDVAAVVESDLEEAPASAVSQLAAADVTNESSLEQSLPASRSNSIVETKIARAEIVDSDSDDSVMVLDDTKAAESDDSDVVTVQESKSMKSDETTELMEDLLQNAVPLTNLPNLGDTLVFKLYKIKNSQKSGLTEYLAGSCAYINRRTKAMIITIISSPPKVQSVLNQYSSALDDTGDEESVVLNLKLNDLIEPQVIVSTID